MTEFWPVSSTLLHVLLESPLACMANTFGCNLSWSLHDGNQPLQKGGTSLDGGIKPYSQPLLASGLNIAVAPISFTCSLHDGLICLQPSWPLLNGHWSLHMGAISLNGKHLAMQTVVAGLWPQRNCMGHFGAACKKTHLAAAVGAIMQPLSL